MILKQPIQEKTTDDTVGNPNLTLHLLDSTVSRPTHDEPEYFESIVETETGIHWWRLTPNCPAKFTPELVARLRRFQEEFGLRMRNLISTGRADEVPRYHVLTSDIDGIFNLGGDLSYFYRLIRDRKREQLAKYARDCVDLVYRNAVAFDLPMTTIALVKGNALGGGMEAALSARVIVAERHVRMGLPEVLFNMFPGMGAYQYLCRRMTPLAAERLILSGKLYEAEELYEMGVVDHVVDTGEGEEEVRRLVHRERNHMRASIAFRKAVNDDDPVTRERLMEFVESWVDAAMALEERDLSHMRYLIRSQQDRGL
jgi:DSF synthase